MTEATLNKANQVRLALTRVSGFIETLSDGDPSETNLLVTVSPPAERAPEPSLHDQDVALTPYATLASYEEPVTLSSADYLRTDPQTQHPLISEFYAELAGWLLERLPALEAELKQEFDAL